MEKNKTKKYIIRDKQPEDVVFYQKIYDWLEGRHIEQKPVEWSEHDEKMRLRAVEYISGLQDDYLEDWEELHPGVAYRPITSYDEVLDWLKSLPMRCPKLSDNGKPSEEQQMPDSTQLIAEWEREKAVLEQKDFRGDTERMAYNAFLDGFVKGIGYGCTE